MIKSGVLCDHVAAFLVIKFRRSAHLTTIFAGVRSYAAMTHGGEGRTGTVQDRAEGQNTARYWKFD